MSRAADDGIERAELPPDCSAGGRAGARRSGSAAGSALVIQALEPGGTRLRPDRRAGFGGVEIPADSSSVARSAQSKADASRLSPAGNTGTRNGRREVGRRRPLESGAAAGCFAADAPGSRPGAGENSKHSTHRPRSQTCRGQVARQNRRSSRCRLIAGSSSQRAGSKAVARTGGRSSTRRFPCGSGLEPDRSRARSQLSPCAISASSVSKMRP